MSRTIAARRTLRVLILGAVLLVVAALAGPRPAARAQTADDGQEIRTEVNGIGGYTIETSAAPLAILFYEPTIPIPADPGDPHFEVTESHTQADLSTGPRARAVASSIWPGAGASGGFPQFADGEEYPIMAEATYPGGQQEESQELPNGAGMHAVALGLDVRADATSQETPSEELATFGNVSSTSISTVTEEGLAVSRSDSSMQGVSLLAGIITIDSLRTRLEATSDGEEARTGGTTAVSGLTIAGYGYTVDEDGVRPVEEDEAGDGIVPAPSSLPGAEEMRELLGIEVEPVAHEERAEGASASRRAGGLKITVDTGPLRQALDTLPLAEIVGELPDDVRAELYPILGLSPTIEFIFGSGRVYTTASLPLDLDLDLDVPPPPPAEAPPPVDPGSTADTSAPESSGEGAVGTSTAPELGQADEPPPEVAPAPEREEPVAASAQVDLFDGIPPALVALALGAAALGAHGLRRLTPLVMAGGGPSGTCSQGLVKAVPDL